MSQNFNTFKQEIEAIYAKGIEQEEEEGQRQDLETARDEKIALLKDKIEKLSFWDKIQDGPVTKQTTDTSKKEEPSRFSIMQETTALKQTQRKKQEEAEVPKRTFPVSNDNVYHFHPIAFVEHMKLIVGNEGVIEITRKWEHWTGSNYNSTTISSFEVGGTKIKGYIAEPYGAETIRSGKDKRIPVGTYNLTWHTSDNFPKDKYIKKGRPILENGFPKLYNDKVSKDRGILIHVGNDGEDSEGCLLPGKGLKKKDEKVVGIKSSTDMFYELISYIEKNGINNVKVTIKDEI